MGSWVSKPYYQCVRCGNCCRWPGLVRVSTEDIHAIAEFLRMDERDFIEQHTRLRPSREGLALNEHEDGSCIFLEGKNICQIQDVKPVQCRGFPNLWQFEGWRDMCESIELPENPQDSN